MNSISANKLPLHILFLLAPLAGCDPATQAPDAGAMTDAATRADGGTTVTDALTVDAATSADAGSECVTLANAAAAIEWTNVVATPGCYFFSGPLRTNSYFLGQRGGVMGQGTLSFEGGSVFLATATGYARTLGCDAGSDWTIEETFTGTWSDWPAVSSCDARPTFRGTYAYTECETGPDGTCTPTASDCTLSATVTVRVVPASELAPRPIVPAAATVTSTCTAACEARAMVRSDSDPEQPCEEADPSCIETCVEEIAGPCGPENYAYRACLATQPTAFVCLDPASAVITDPEGPCGSVVNEVYGCEVDPTDCEVR